MGQGGCTSLAEPRRGGRARVLGEVSEVALRERGFGIRSLKPHDFTEFTAAASLLPLARKETLGTLRGCRGCHRRFVEGHALLHNKEPLDHLATASAEQLVR
jgi:hypothetical protein